MQHQQEAHRASTGLMPPPLSPVVTPSPVGGEAREDKQNPNQNKEQKEGQGKGDAQNPPAPEEPMLKIGQMLRHWIITTRIGGGAFGETYTAVAASPAGAERDGGAMVTPHTQGSGTAEVCIKVEKNDKRMVLRLEVLALKKVQSCPHVVRYISSGRQNELNFLVMEKLGENLSELRKVTPNGVFELYTVLHIGMNCIQAIQGIHELGLIHRDIKPSNFVVGNTAETKRKIFLIDFGLAKRYRGSNGDMKPARENAGFRGTSRYASLNSHRHKELGRVDDLWSLLFMLIEFLTGSLPWRRTKDKDAIMELKAAHIGPSLVRNLPREFTPFLEHLQSMSYESEPNYGYLNGLLQHCRERRGYPLMRTLEWEIATNVAAGITKKRSSSGKHHRHRGSKPAGEEGEPEKGEGDQQQQHHEEEHRHHHHHRHSKPPETPLEQQQPASPPQPQPQEAEAMLELDEVPEEVLPKRRKKGSKSASGSKEVEGKKSKKKASPSTAESPTRPGGKHHRHPAGPVEGEEQSEPSPVDQDRPPQWPEAQVLPTPSAEELRGAPGPGVPQQQRENLFQSVPFPKSSRQQPSASSVDGQSVPTVYQPATAPHTTVLQVATDEKSLYAGTRLVDSAAATGKERPLNVARSPDGAGDHSETSEVVLNTPSQHALDAGPPAPTAAAAVMALLEDSHGHPLDPETRAYLRLQERNSQPGRSSPAALTPSTKERPPVFQARQSPPSEEVSAVVTRQVQVVGAPDEGEGLAASLIRQRQYYAQQQQRQPPQDTVTATMSMVQIEDGSFSNPEAYSPREANEEEDHIPEPKPALPATLPKPGFETEETLVVENVVEAEGPPPTRHPQAAWLGVGHSSSTCNPDEVAPVESIKISSSGKQQKHGRSVSFSEVEDHRRLSTSDGGDDKRDENERKDRTVDDKAGCGCQCSVM